MSRFAARAGSIDPSKVTADEIAAFSRPARGRTVVLEPESPEVQGAKAKPLGRLPSAAPAPPPRQRRASVGFLPSQETKMQRRKSVASDGGTPEKSEDQLACERVTECFNAFSLFDKDGDGSISAVELALAFRKLGKHVDREQVRSLMAEVDKNDDGELDFSEFMDLMSRNDASPHEQHQYAFKCFDQDADGYIDANELQRVMESLDEPLTDAEAQTMISSVDEDGDGRIDFVEFSRLMMAK